MAKIESHSKHEWCHISWLDSAWTECMDHGGIVIVYTADNWAQ